MKFDQHIRENKFIKTFEIDSKETITQGHLQGTTKYTFPYEGVMCEVYYDNLGFAVEFNGKAYQPTMLQMMAHEEAKAGA